MPILIYLCKIKTQIEKIRYKTLLMADNKMLHKKV